LNGTEDWDYFLRIMRNNPLAQYVSQSLMYYRVHSESMTTKMKHSREERETRMINKQINEFGYPSIHLIYPYLRFSVNPRQGVTEGYMDYSKEMTMNGGYHYNISVTYQKKGMRMGGGRIESYLNLCDVYSQNKKFGLLKGVIERMRRKYDMTREENRRYMYKIVNFEKYEEIYNNMKENGEESIFKIKFLGK
jgi:hypothetical protein